MSDFRTLIAQSSLQAINSLTKYPSILTLHELGEKGVLTNNLNLDIRTDVFAATEKIDGTNVRILLHADDYIIGAREELLTAKGDLLYNPSQDIVQHMKPIVDNLRELVGYLPGLTVVYGELYGGKTGSNSKQYGKETTGFRVFDVVEIPSTLMIQKLALPVDQIARWREHNNGERYEYGQPFLDSRARKEFCSCYNLEEVPFRTNYVLSADADLSHQQVLQLLKLAVPTTTCALSDTALGKAEGMVLKADNPRRMVKIRYEDYERTLRVKS